MTGDEGSQLIRCSNIGAANRFPDKCEADPTGARAINIDASASLASACSARGSLLIYISTDYVFPGVPGHAPYEADAEPAPTNLYGQTKLDGEKAVLSTMEKEDGKGVGVVLRVPVLYGEADQPSDSAVNVLMDAVWKAQDKDASISMDDWALRYPTNTEDVARVCVDIAAEYTQPGVDARSLPKILQFSSEHRVTKYQICQIFADIMGLSLDGMKGNKEGNDPKAAVQRPYDTHLSTRALRELGIHTNCMDFEGWWYVFTFLPNDFPNTS